RVLIKARRLTDAEAGAIFLVRGRGNRRSLESGSLQNDASLGVPPQISLPIAGTSIAAHVARTGERLFLDDLGNIRDRPFAFHAVLDQRLGYVSRTMLAFPLVNDRGAAVAVVQLVNRRLPGSDGPLAFEARHAEAVAPIEHFAGRA